MKFTENKNSGGNAEGVECGRFIPIQHLRRCENVDFVP